MISSSFPFKILHTSPAPATDLFSKVVTLGQSSYLLFLSGGLFSHLHVPIRDNIKSVPRSPLAYNVLTFFGLVRRNKMVQLIRYYDTFKLHGVSKKL